MGDKNGMGEGNGRGEVRDREKPKRRSMAHGTPQAGNFVKVDEVPSLRAESPSFWFFSVQ